MKAASVCLVVLAVGAMLVMPPSIGRLEIRPMAFFFGLASE